MDRRAFLVSAGAMAIATPLKAQDAPTWSSPVLDLHWHMRKSPEANLAHMAGSGVAQANLLAGSGG